MEESIQRDNSTKCPIKTERTLMVRVGDIVFKEKHILQGLVDMAQIMQNFFCP